MKRYSKRNLGLAILAGTGIGIFTGCMVFNERMRHQIGRKWRRLGRACRNQSEELRETAHDLFERGGRNWKDARETGRRVYERLHG